MSVGMLEPPVEAVCDTVPAFWRKVVIMGTTVARTVGSLLDAEEWIERSNVRPPRRRVERPSWPPADPGWQTVRLTKVRSVG